jgi:hypothetical protein
MMSPSPLLPTPCSPCLRVAGNKGKGGNSDGDGNEEGFGKEEGNSKGGKSDGNSDKGGGRQNARAARVMTMAAKRLMAMKKIQAWALAMGLAGNKESNVEGSKSDDNGNKEGGSKKKVIGNGDNMGDGNRHEGGRQQRGQWEKTTIN